MITIHAHRGRPPAPLPIERELGEVGEAIGRAIADAGVNPEIRSIVSRIEKLEVAVAEIRDRPLGMVRRMVHFVALAKNVSPQDLMSKRRGTAGTLSHYRFAIMWATRQLTDYSLPMIGHSLGGRDHTTVMNGLARAKEFREADPAFRALTDALIHEFSAKPKAEEADPCLPL